MRASFTPATRAQASLWLDRLATQPLNYWELGHTQAVRVPDDYADDDVRVQVGQGSADFKTVKEALVSWAMFPKRWTQIVVPSKAQTLRPPSVGDQVLVEVRLFGFWWHNPARIVYTIDTPTMFGFAYGTLPGHFEQGEELFEVEMDDTGAVFYRIRAMSRPLWWGAQLLAGFARKQQARFRNESMQQMKKLVAQARQTESYQESAGAFVPSV